MTINGVQGGWFVISMPVPGGGGGGVRRHNRRLSRGVEQNRSLSRGHLQVVPGRWRYNISLSRGAFIYCPGGGGLTFAIIVICRGVRLKPIMY